MDNTKRSAKDSDSTVDVEAILNRARVNLARSQKLVEGWMPSAKKEHDVEMNSYAFTEESVEPLILRPERAGLGADITQGGNGDPLIPLTKFSSSKGLETLRKQMLGGRTATVGASVARSKAGFAGDGTAPNRTGTAWRRPRADDSVTEDEDEGRTASFKSKRKKTTMAVPLSTSKHIPQRNEIPEQQVEDVQDVEPKQMTRFPNDGEAGTNTVETMGGVPRDTRNNSDGPSRPRSSYLDQVLAERSRKKKKKNKKKKLKSQE